MVESKLNYRPIRFNLIPENRRGRLDSLIMRHAGKTWSQTLTDNDAIRLYNAWVHSGENAFPRFGVIMAEELRTYLDKRGLPYDTRVPGSGKGRQRPHTRGFRAK